VYSVGPATTRALRAVSQDPPLNIFGAHTGNGDKLAQFILEHYGEWYQDRAEKPPLLFMVGEQRRDIIPKTLMDSALPSSDRIQVDELVVYGTDVKETFKEDLTAAILATGGRSMTWAVVFSPTGCGSMLECFGLLDESTGKAKATDNSGRMTWVATIGPTTRDHLVRKYRVDPDVCASSPSPEGVRDGIVEFIRRHGL
jgi:uroporphyrinogen-III synthase